MIINRSIKDYLENEIQFVDDSTNAAKTKNSSTSSKKNTAKKTNRDYVEELLLEYMGSSDYISFEELQSWMVCTYLIMI